jgi:hypothetical protein
VGGASVIVRVIAVPPPVVFHAKPQKRKGSVRCVSLRLCVFA